MPVNMSCPYLTVWGAKMAVLSQHYVLTIQFSRISTQAWVNNIKTHFNVPGPPCGVCNNTSRARVYLEAR